MDNTRNIPIFELNQGAKAGFFIRQMCSPLDGANHDVASAHRDNSYLLLLIKSGQGRIMIDFDEVIFSGPACCLIHPDQVHSVLEAHRLEGWFFAFDPGLLTAASVPLIAPLTRLSLLDQPADSLELLDKLTGLLWHTFQVDEKQVDQPLMLRYLLNALLTLVASLEPTSQRTNITRINRVEEITTAFRQLLKDKFTSWKRPAQYAHHLNLSVNHLNDSVKAKTGYSVSHWIQHQTMLEAKRQLYHTQLPIKQIAYQLGFQDQHYFSRLFHKVTGQAPHAFRQSFRDTSTTSGA